ncbi:MAG: adenosylcobinamide amidohydrolase [Proteobacteria bacterium]|nr:adenosylcobinamide amidohydrolase [Pseudomonadota bacterium]MBU1640542.1 adenosylcobinamide amidohydrolase [Pseudomonadota bacterium]
MKQFNFLLVMLFLLLPEALQATEYPISFIDSSGQDITVNRPGRVVSLVPSITEMLLRIGAGDTVVGTTYHPALPPDSVHSLEGIAGKELVGGFFSPDLDRVAALQPDVIFYADLQKDVPIRFRDKATLIQLSARSIAESFDHLKLLGRIFSRNGEAAEIIAEEKRQLAVIASKIAKIPEEKKQRTIRLMGRDKLMTPGDDSFQNEYIRAAGGIAPQFGKNGNIISVDLDQWQEFNPQVIYGCGDVSQTIPILDQPGWRDVDAVRNKRFFFFPCELTCRAATHPGYFTSWLAARIYGDEFSAEGNFVLPEQVVSRVPLKIGLDYLQQAEIIAADIKDFRHKTVALTFKHPMQVVSTLEGQRSGITTVANHYMPPPSWWLGHEQGLAPLRKFSQRALGFTDDSTAMLFTGANMDNLVVVKKQFRGMEVTALVTAGVKSNAMRMSADTGSFYEPDTLRKNKNPGTINILLLSNMQLSPRAMTRALITATEAKSAALQDLDIRSTFSPAMNQASGTGTDNIIVVQGAGNSIDSSGGHTKMGELMARAVYEGVQQAVLRQNGLQAARSIFQRLKERKISLHTICKPYATQEKAKALRKQMEIILLQPQYASFLKSIMAISDDYEKGLVDDLSSVDLWCQTVAKQIAGGEMTVEVKDVENLPKVLAKGLSALLAGALEKLARN